MASAAGYAYLRNNYASSSKTDLTKLASIEGLPDASTAYGTFPFVGAGRKLHSQPSQQDSVPSSPSTITLVNESDSLLFNRGRSKSRQRYSSGLSLSGLPKLEKVDEHGPSILDKINPQLFLENAGCVARDHLASERTFLSYVRTSLAISMTGIVFVQLLSIRPAETKGPLDGHEGLGHPTGLARPLAVYTILTGIFTLLVGVVRYFTVQSTLIKGSFKPSRVCMGMLAFTTSGLIVGAFGVLLVHHRGRMW